MISTSDIQPKTNLIPNPIRPRNSRAHPTKPTLSKRHLVNGNVKQAACGGSQLANRPNIFQMLLVYFFLFFLNSYYTYRRLISDALKCDNVVNLVVLSKECVFLIVLGQKEHHVGQDDGQHVCYITTSYIHAAPKMTMYATVVKTIA